MNIETARVSVGMVVMSYDSGNGMRRCPMDVPMGPFRLKQITKGGDAILFPGDMHVRPKHLFLHTDQTVEITEPDYRNMKFPPDFVYVNPAPGHALPINFKSEPITFTTLHMKKS